MRVLHVIGGGEFGGAERYVLDLLTHLDPRRFEPAIACFYPGPFEAEARAARLAVDVLPNRGPYDWRLARTIAHRLRERPVDLVHTHGVRAHFFTRRALARLGRPVPLLTTVHSRLAEDYPRWPNRLLALALERLSRGGTDRFIAVSQGIAGDLAARGVPRERIAVIYGGIDLDRLLPAPRGTLREELGIPPEAPLVGVVARLHPVKGQADFLRAAARLVPAHPAVRFVLIGEGEDRPRLERLASALGLGERVHFLGFRKPVAPLLADLDAAVTPSRSEGLGLATLEAMALGRPVVATAVGGLVDLVRDGETGLLVPPRRPDALAAAIDRLLRDPALARRLGEAGREVPPRFSAKRMAERIGELYLERAGGGAGERADAG